MNANALTRILSWSLLSVCTLWLVIPFAMAILWSLVSTEAPWTPDLLLPPSLSFERWIYMWENSSLQPALWNSYRLAPTVAIVTLLLALPTAYAFGRLTFKGKAVLKLIALLPLVVPPFVIAIFFTSILYQLGLFGWRFGAITVGHTVIYLPFAIRILTVSFEQVRQDHIDAARDLGASAWARFRVAYWPALKPGILAAFLIVFIQSIEEFAIAYIIGSPHFYTVPTLLYSALGANFIRPNAAVLSLILVVPNVLLMLVLERLMKSANPTLSSGKG